MGTLPAARANTSSSAPRAMPRATLDTTSETNAGVWTRAMGSSMHGSPSSGTKVRSGGRLRSSTRKWWLAVAHMPVAVQRVLDDDVIGGEQGRAEHRVAVHEPLDAVAEDPVGVLAPAAERPSALDPVAAVDGRDGPGGVERAGHDHAGTLREDSVEGGARQVDEIAPRAATDHHDPRHRRVRGGQVLVQAHGGHDVVAGATVAGGDEHVEAAHGREVVEQVARHAPRRFDLGRSSRDGRKKVGDGRRGRGTHGRTIGASAACRARSSSSQPPLQ